MNEIDATKFIDEELRPRFPDWAPEECDITEWVRRLQWYDYARAANELQVWWFGQMRRSRLPAPGLIFKVIAKAYIAKAGGPCRDVHDLFYIVTRDGRRYGPWVHLGHLPSKEAIERAAVQTANDVADAYGGRPVTIHYCYNEGLHDGTEIQHELEFAPQADSGIPL